MSETSVSTTAADTSGVDPARWVDHTPYTDPGPYRERLAAVPPEPTELSRVADNLIIHYRASGLALAAETRQDINARWLSAILDLDHRRHPEPLDAPREPVTRVQGCCRDHALFAAAVLREHRRPARIRYGFARYFDPEFSHDHVVVETWLPKEHRWLRFDPEMVEPTPALPTPQDIPAGSDAPFITAAEAWRGFRTGTLDPGRYGVDASLPLRGPWFIQCAVMLDAAFRAGAELLLWDGWAAMSDPDGPTEEQVSLTDEIVRLIIAADAGDGAAEQRLLDRVGADDGVGPGSRITMMSPYGDPPVQVDLGAGPVLTGPGR